MSVDADKACTAVAPSSESAESTMGDEWNKQKKQQKKREKKQQQQERKKRKEQQQDQKKQSREEKKREKKIRKKARKQVEVQGQQITATEPAVTKHSDSAITVCRIWFEDIPNCSEATLNFTDWKAVCQRSFGNDSRSPGEQDECSRCTRRQQCGEAQGDTQVPAPPALGRRLLGYSARSEAQVGNI